MLSCTPAATWTLAIGFLLIGTLIGAFVVGWLRREKFELKVAIAEQLARVRIRHQFDQLVDDLEGLAEAWPTIDTTVPAWDPPRYGRAFAD